MPLSVAIVLACLYLYGLAGAGLVGPDEPRYASISRQMARSGDWITPRLWGEPWFEKPALLYWMTGAALRLGISDDLAPRLPGAILGVAFLIFFAEWLRREFGARAAFYSAAILGTSAGWLAFSRVGVTDMPLSATFGAAMLLALPWIARHERSTLPAAASLLGLAVLAKGLVPLVLAVPALWFGRRHLGDLLRPLPLLLFAAAALPWYVLCTLRNGMPFVTTFFVQHQIGRFTSPDLQHVQPFWFYIPVMAGLMFPWCFLLGLPFRRHLFDDARLRFLLAWIAFGFVFFSASTNKLPGYLLPLLPPVAALIGIALARARLAGGWLLSSTLLLVAIPVAAGVLPEALVSGMRSVYPVDPSIGARAALWLPVLFLLGIAALIFDRRGSRDAAVALTTGTAAIALIYLIHSTVPAIDRQASARPLWIELKSVPGVCIDNLNRSWRYGLNYYSITPLPDCSPGTSGPRVMLQGGRAVLSQSKKE